MKLAAISVIRDESDVVEAWVRHNLHFVDRMYIVDDGSSDQTRHILDLLSDEGLPITVTSEKSLGAYHQGRRTSRLIEEVMRACAWDYVFPLDGDEFLVAADRSTLERDLSAIGCYRLGGLNPRHYLMTDQDDPTDPCPFTRLKHVAVHEPYAFKVVVPGPLAAERGFSIVDGNHQAAKWNVPLPVTLLPNVELVHFPARSEAQLVSKGLSGYMRWSARTDFENGAPARLIEGVGILKEEGDIKVQALHRLSTALGASRGAEQSRLHPFTELRGEVRYPDLAHIFPYRRVLSATDDLVHAFKEVLDENRALKERAETFQSRIRSLFRKRREKRMKRADLAALAQAGSPHPVGS